MDIGIRGDEARALSEHILKTYFTTRDYPYTCHHIDSYDQFLSDDLPAIIRAKNPLLTLQDQIGKTGVYAYKAEVFVGGLEGKQIYIGTPSVALRDSKEGRLLFPNEARLRNLTYAATVQADIVIRVTLSSPNPSGGEPISQEITLDPVADPANYGYLGKFPLFRVPIMLHSRYCLLNGKPQEFLKEVGECQYDFGGYFIVDGSEKVLITHQQQAFNTLRIRKQPRDPKIALFSSIACLNPRTREVRKINFLLKRRENTLALTLPFVRKEVPIFVIFRALGIQSDYDILRLIFPDPESAEAKMLEPMLHESMLEAFPFYDTFSALQYIKVLTKGFSEAHVLHILYNQTFIHVENRPRARATFLAECVRRILRVAAGLDTETDQDDTRNQRCITSGVLIRSLFQDIYDGWTKKTLRNLDEEYKYHPSTYSGTNFVNLFLQGTLNEMFNEGLIRENIMRAFKGKWSAGSGSAVGEEKSGVIQALSRLSYLDFLSHCRRAVLDFDTGMKLPSPRRLHTSQYGYFCTSETPGGASIGITKNLSMLTSISTATDPSSFIEWLFERGGVVPCEKMTPKTVAISVPVFVNAGIVGYTYRPLALRDALKTLKWVGALPATSSVGFSMRDRRIFVYMDEGRPMRPLIHLGRGGKLPAEALKRASSWRDLVMGVLPVTKGRSVAQSGFIDPLAREEAPTLEDYVTKLMPSTGVIEYVDPYEMNEAFVANFPEHIQSETSHMEIHPSTIVGLLTSMIPFANHNQSPRNQLSCSQSKQGISIYSTAYPTRYDNQTHVLCYPQAPIARTIYYDYLADGKMGYGANLILAMGCFTGYNQDDGIVMNADTIERGMFRSTSYRGYEAFEEDDPLTRTKTRIANPVSVSSWTSLKPGLDYTKLDERGIIRPGEIVDETTVLVGRYLQSVNGDMKDASLTAQVWTRGRVEQVSVTKSNQGMAMVKVRVVQERLPELGDKFSNRHGQKGTIGMLVRGYDMPRRRDGIPVDMIMNTHAMPSRMTVAQLLEALVGKAAPALGATANCTLFMNEGSPAEAIGAVLRDQLGMEPLGEELLYDGMSGCFIPSKIFVGSVYTMRLKHMPEDKWNARAEGRREQRTHQPTGGRGAQGGLRIGEMERDAILGHGVASFMRESLMKRADGYSTWICDGCGTIPIYNESENKFVCSMCDGPVKYIGESATNLELLPPSKRSIVGFSKVEIPYAFKLLDQELNTYLNMGLRVLTEKGVKKLRPAPLKELTDEQQRVALTAPLPERILPETTVPELIQQQEELSAREEDLDALGAATAEAVAAQARSEAEAEAAAEEAQRTAMAASAVPVPGAPAPQTLGALGPAPANGLPTVVLQPAAPAAPPRSIVMGETLEGGLEAQQLPDLGGIPTQAPAASPYPVNVQAASQPVLVMPVNVAQPVAAAPTGEYYPPAAPGAPGVFAVDTSPQAMASAGFSSGSPGAQRGGARASSPGGSGAPRLNITKAGGSGADSAAMSNPNVRITVNKMG